MLKTIFFTPRRLKYFCLTVLIVIIGLASRQLSAIPVITGDILYAIMIFFGLRFLFPYMKVSSIAVLAISFCFFIEFSQLYHVEWIDAIRNTRLGALVLGKGFLWSDILAYTIGVLISLAAEIWIIQTNFD